jgi:hypothetical protein
MASNSAVPATINPIEVGKGRREARRMPVRKASESQRRG